MCYHRMMPRLILAALGLLILVPAVQAADPLSEARRLYNAGQYEAAARAAREALTVDGLADPARVVLGRVQLERFRQTADPADLSAARESFRSVDPAPLKYRERLELTIGQAEILYRTIGSVPPPSSSRPRSIGPWCSAPPRTSASWTGGLLRWIAMPSCAPWRIARLSTPGSSNACVPSSRSMRDRRQRATGWQPPHAAPAISIEPGRPRLPGGSARASLRIEEPRCAPTWIAS